jgi:hypothetical protein
MDFHHTNSIKRPNSTSGGRGVVHIPYRLKKLFHGKIFMIFSGENIIAGGH